MAVRAEVAFGTVWKYDNGGMVRPAMAAAIKKAMKELGIEDVRKAQSKGGS